MLFIKITKLIFVGIKCDNFSDINFFVKMPGIALGAIRGDLTVPGAGDWVSVGRQEFIHDITL